MIANITAPAFANELPRVVSLVREAMEGQHRELADIISGNASGGVLHEDTGLLASSVEESTEVTGSVITSTVWNDVVYGPTQEFGAVIVARDAKALRFEAEGEVVFTPRVIIPARPWFYPAWEEQKPEIVAAIDAAIAEAVQ